MLQYALGLGILGAIIWLLYLIWIYSYEIVTFEILTALIPFIAIFIAWRKNIIGSWLVVISSLIPVIVYFSSYQAANSSDQVALTILVLPVTALTTVPLLLSGLFFLILRRRQGQSLKQR